MLFNSEIVGDSLYIIDLPGGDTTYVEFTAVSTDSFIDGIVMIAADTSASDYYALPGKPFTVDLQSEPPPTGGALSNENVYAYPNPFNPDTERVKFRFQLAQEGNVTIKVYDVSNTLVKTVISNSPRAAAIEHEESWDGKNESGKLVANGVYFYIIDSSSGERAVNKVAVLR